MREIGFGSGLNHTNDTKDGNYTISGSGFNDTENGSAGSGFNQTDTVDMGDNGNNMTDMVNMTTETGGNTTDMVDMGIDTTDMVDMGIDTTDMVDMGSTIDDITDTTDTMIITGEHILAVNTDMIADNETTPTMNEGIIFVPNFSLLFIASMTTMFL